MRISKSHLVLGLISTCTPALGFAIDKPGICKAAIATVVDRNPAIMAAEFKTGAIHVHLRRLTNDKRLTYRCRIDGNRIVWGLADGRWRERNEDGVIRYKVDDDHVRVELRFSDDSVLEGRSTTKT